MVHVVRWLSSPQEFLQGHGARIPRMGVGGLLDGRLVWASAGQLRVGRLGRGKLLGEKLLYDFNDMKFEAIAAPY